MILFAVSSLEKIFQDTEPVRLETPLSVLRCDHLSFQAALYMEPERPTRRYDLPVHVTTALSVSIRSVRNVPVSLPAFDASDGKYLRTSPGLYPDLLEPLYEDHVVVTPGRWQSLWIEITTHEKTTPGAYSLTLTVGSAMLKVQVNVLDAILPPSGLRHTEWFHYDCLSQFYHEPVWSQNYWKLLERQLKVYVLRGINMLLVPLWTPPLDTRYGHERKTVQLLDVTVRNGQYTFGFDRLRHFLEVASAAGIQYFEMSHFYTQWGAEHCPKITADVDGEEKKLFGWEDAATGERYRAFLNALLSPLTEKLESWGLKDKVYFHISDEPAADHIEQYRACRKQVEKALSGFRIMDAMSSFQYYAEGLCQIPVVASDHLDPFLTDKRPDELWTYYCCSQGHDVSNRFIAMPSSRTRIFGLQAYLYGIDGFLHWGFNYYNNQTSMHPIDPFASTDGECSYPAGDPFVIYPGPDGEPWESLRLVVFHDGLHDLAACRYLEALSSREHVLSLLQEPVTMTSYPITPDFLIHFRNRINHEITRILS